MRKEIVLLEAEFDAKLQVYWMLSVIIVLFVSVVGIPLIPLWLIFGRGLHRKQLENLSCSLTERTLNLKRGVIFQVEKNIPLDKIQDVGLREGPILRRLGLASLSIETAGQSAPQGGADAALVGVIDPLGFRDAVLNQREAIVHKELPKSDRALPVPQDQDSAVLVEIRDSLHRIEDVLRAAGK
jgi:putative membrane protein